MNLDTTVITERSGLGAGSCTLYRSRPISELSSIFYESHKTILLTNIFVIRHVSL